MVAALPGMLLVLGSLGTRTVTGLDAFAFYSHKKEQLRINEDILIRKGRVTLITKISGRYCLNYETWNQYWDKVTFCATRYDAVST